MEKYIFVEMPDQKVKVEFADKCQVRLELNDDDPMKLRVYVQGCDDRATIVLDEEVDLPEPDLDK